MGNLSCVSCRALEDKQVSVVSAKHFYGAIRERIRIAVCPLVDVPRKPKIKVNVIILHLQSTSTIRPSRLGDMLQSIITFFLIFAASYVISP